MADIVRGEPWVHLFFMLLDDARTPAIGKTPTVTVSKSGAPFAAINGNVQEVGKGWYAAYLQTRDTDVIGELAYDQQAAGCIVLDAYKDVVVLPPPSPVFDDTEIIVILQKIANALRAK